MIDRIIRAIRLNPTLYREVADDAQYTDEAVVVVIGAILLSAAGALIGEVLNDGRPMLNFIVQVANMLIFGWLLWAVVAYFVGTALGGKSSVTELARALAYANTPRLLGLFGFIPCAGALISLAGVGLTFAAGVIAIREAMEFDTTDGVVTAILGLGPYIVFSLILAFYLGGLGVLGMIIQR